MKYDMSYLKKARTEDGKNHFVKIGTAYDYEDGTGRVFVHLDALPLGQYWDGSFILFPKPKDDKA